MTNTKSMKFKVDEPSAEIVKKIYDLYLKGWGYKKIANYLTDYALSELVKYVKQRARSISNVQRMPGVLSLSVPYSLMISISALFVSASTAVKK